MMFYKFQHLLLVTPENGILVAKNRANTGEDWPGSVFRLCNGENLCPESSRDCGFKAKICVVNDDAHKTISEIRFDKAHGYVIIINNFRLLQ